MSPSQKNNPVTLVHQVNALAERVGHEFQKQAHACAACPWHQLQRVQHTFWDNAVMGAWFFNPPLIGLNAWSAFWQEC